MMMTTCSRRALTSSTEILLVENSSKHLKRFPNRPSVRLLGCCHLHHLVQDASVVVCRRRDCPNAPLRRSDCAPTTASCLKGQPLPTSLCETNSASGGVQLFLCFAWCGAPDSLFYAGRFSFLLSLMSESGYVRVQAWGRGLLRVSPSSPSPPT